LVSLNGFRKDYLRLNFPVDEIVRQYKDWVSEDTYMILSKWNKEEWKNDVFAVKCAKYAATKVVFSDNFELKNNQKLNCNLG